MSWSRKLALSVVAVLLAVLTGCTFDVAVLYGSSPAVAPSSGYAVDGGTGDGGLGLFTGSDGGSGSHRAGASSPYAYPVGPAGGDLSGTFPNPTVNAKGINVVTSCGVDNTGTVNAGTTLTTCFTKLAALGQAAWIPAGTYKLTTQALVPQGGNLTIIGSPNALLIGNMTLVDNNTAIIDAPFQTTAYSQTLNADVVIGSITMHTSGTLPTVGTYVLGSTAASGNFKVMGYRVLTAGAGAFTVDRPIQLPLKSGDSIQGIVPYANVKIFGNGMRLTTTGTGVERLVELLTCWDCYVADLILDGSAGGVHDRLMSIDDAGYRTVVERIWGDGGGVTTDGISTETAEAVTIRDSTVNNAVNGIVDQDGIGCLYDNDHANGSTGGGFSFDTGSNSIDLTGGTGSTVLGGSYVNNAVGITILNGQHETIAGSTTSYGTNGVFVGGGNTPVVGAIVRGLTSISNAGSGVYLGQYSSGAKVISSVFGANGGAAVYSDVGSTGTVVDACDVSGVIGLHAKAPVTASNLSGTCSSNSVLLDSAASAVTLSNSVFTPTYAGFAIDLATSGASLALDGVSILGEPSGNFTIAVFGGTTLNALNLTITGTGAYALYSIASTSVMNLGRGVNVQGATTSRIYPNPPTGPVNVSQSGWMAVNATHVMTFSEAMSAEVESSGNASGTVTITAAEPVPGMQWVFRNNNTASSTTTFMGITVAVGKTATIRINSSAAGERVSPDTLLDLDLLKVRLPGVPNNDNAWTEEKAA